MAVEVPADVRVLGPAIPTPVRRLGSVRRTSTIDAIWPEGAGTPMHLFGRSRDLLTPSDGSTPVVLIEDSLEAVVEPDRTTTSLSSIPARVDLQPLVGVKGGGGSRARVVQQLPEEVAAGTPLYLLLDDLAGATLVSGFAFTHWRDKEEDFDFNSPETKARKISLQGICAGFQKGASALGVDGNPPAVHAIQPVPDLVREDDPFAWHELFQVVEVSSRRSRRMDVWREGDQYVIDAFFQDAGTSPGGPRIAVHEYTIQATVDATTGLVTAIQALPQVLPFRECPLASVNVSRLVGQPLREFRTIVNEQLPGIDGCTHMNDALRALAEVPVLAAQIR
ncbi:MAG: DUF2889 domain-containing protein [Actinomycetota bacterium]|nr:DUF2889 domain-containing protein [Actinomycetota bacterium]